MDSDLFGELLGDFDDLKVFIYLCECLFGFLQILIGDNLVFPEALIHRLSHQLPVLSPHHGQCVVDGLLPRGDLFKEVMIILNLLFFF